LKALQTR